MANSEEQINFVISVYNNFKLCHEQARAKFARPLTLAEKILSSHLHGTSINNDEEIIPGQSVVGFKPDRIAMQDATAQMALLQFISANVNTTSVPTTIHCDHLVAANKGAQKDLSNANIKNKEVYDFLRTAAKKYGIGFFPPGSGIIHQVVLEKYAFPGGMMIGTDSHTPNAGGLAMIAVGVGGADAVDAMVGAPFELKWPKIIGVHLKNSLSGWASPKDVILKLMSILTVRGGTGSIVEFFGEGAKNISCTGKGTITNMGAEHGATCSIFPYDLSMKQYLLATGRNAIAQLADQNVDYLTADPEVLKTPEKYFSKVIEIDLAKLEPLMVGPHTPDLCRSLPELKEAIKKENYIKKISACLIGSCTNSSYEDISRASSIAKEAIKHGLKAKVPFYITPGSETVFQTIKEDKLLEPLEQIGGTVLANACGPCIGQWDREDKDFGNVNTIVSSYNRNFPGRNDGSAKTMSFLTSPEVVVAMALTGDLSFDPVNDHIKTYDGTNIKLSCPIGQDLPNSGLKYEVMPDPDMTVHSNEKILIDRNSDRLSLLEAFKPNDSTEWVSMPILLKAKGKCTTDHISQAGVWLKYRGHLDKIANNTYLGAFNDFTGESGTGLLSGENKKLSLPDLARIYKDKNISFAVIGDENFGEGSSREHAAMQPRYLGCKVIIAKSFARIHENNLKKQGILALTFANKEDYDLIEAHDKITIKNLPNIKIGQSLDVIIESASGDKKTIKCQHTYSKNQLNWFYAGSALNFLVK